MGQSGSFIVTTAGGKTIVELGAGTEQVQALGADTITAGSGVSTIYANTDLDPVNVVGGGAGRHCIYILATGTVTEGAGTDQATTYTGGLDFIGGSAIETLSLDAGTNSVTSGSGDLTIFEAAGSTNTYSFTATAAGGSTMAYGITPADTINLTGENVTSLTSLLAETTYSNGNAVIELGGGTTVICAGVSDLSTLTFEFAKAASTPAGGSSIAAGTQSNLDEIHGEPGDNITTQAGGYSNVQLGVGNETATLLGHDRLTSGSGTATVYANNDADSTSIVGDGKGSQGSYIIGSGSTVTLSGGTDQVSSYGSKNIFIAGSDSESAATFSFGGGGNTFTAGSGGSTATVYANNTRGNTFTFLAGDASITTIFGLAATDIVDVSKHARTSVELGAAETESYAGLKLTFANSFGGDTSIVLAGINDPQNVHFNL